ncbi:MAG: amidase, partial [Stackebrandtia sp.]
MTGQDILFAGVARQAELVRSGGISARELTDATLDRIARLDPALNAFRVVLGEQARAEAEARDAAPADGPLWGVPLAVKDEFDVAGQVTGFGGAAQVTAAESDCEMVRRLRAAGAVIVGKTTMSEFGQWPFTESVAHGRTRNPWNPERTPGGSSGGSAAAVASGMVAAAMGGDGGGSIRIPAACCGLFGLKPQRGRVSTAPHPDLWHALGTAGPLTRTVADSAIIYDVLNGTTDVDRWRAGPSGMSFTEAATTAPGSLRIGFSTASTQPGVTPHREHLVAVIETAKLLRGLGHEVERVRARYPDITAAFIPQFYGGVRAEAGLVDHPERLEARTRQTLRLGRATPDSMVEWAVKHGERVAARVNRIFDDVDVLLTPTIAARPRRAGALDRAGSLRAQVLSLPMIAYTAIWNVAGNPAASIPAGHGSDGLPIGVQLVARPDDESTILRVAAQLETARPWA